MNIGQIKIDLYFNQEIGKFYVKTASEEIRQSPQSTGIDTLIDEIVSQDGGQISPPIIGKVPPEWVQLDPDSDDFEEKKSELKAAGYSYNRSSKTWRKKKKSATATPTVEAGWFGDAKEIELSQDDPEFVAKKESLKEGGFKWDAATKTWRKPKVINGSRKSARHRVSKLSLLSAIAMFAGMS